MAKRKSQLADKLASPAPTPGWRDILRPQEPTPETETVQPAPPAAVSREAAIAAPKASNSPKQQFLRKTYLIRPIMIDRINALAEQEAVGINELVRYMLEYALDQIETGEHQLPTQPSKRRISR